MTPRAKPVTYVFQRVADNFNIPLELLLSKSPPEPIRSFKQMAVVICFDVLKEATINQNGIAATLGLDHSTVWHAKNYGRNRARTVPWFGEQIEELTRAIRIELGFDPIIPVEMISDSTCAEALFGAKERATQGLETCAAQQ